MSEKKNARPAGGTAERAAETSTESSTFSTDDFSILTDARQGLNVWDCLLHGEQNALSGTLLAVVLGLRSDRAVRKEVEIEREQGALILSSERGYFKPSLDPETAEAEIQHFIRAQDSRLRSNRRAVRSAKQALRAMQGQELAGQMSIAAGGERGV